MGDDHRDRQLDPLAAVDRARVGESQLVGLLGRQPEHGVLGAEHERRLVLRSSSSLAGHRRSCLRLMPSLTARRRPAAGLAEPVSSSSRSSVPFISPSSCRLRPVIISLSPIRSLPPRTGGPSGFSAARSAWLSASIPSSPAVDGREHLDVAHRVDAVVAGQPLGDQRDDLGQAVAWRGPLDQEQVAAHPVGGDGTRGRCRGGSRAPPGRSSSRPPGGRCGSAASSAPPREATSSANGLPAPTGAS